MSGTATEDTLALSPALREALARWLEQLKALDDASDNTITAYGRDVRGFQAMPLSTLSLWGFRT